MKYFSFFEKERREEVTEIIGILVSINLIYTYIHTLSCTYILKNFYMAATKCVYFFNDFTLKIMVFQSNNLFT